jgi:hypothetical protein
MSDNENKHQNNQNQNQGGNDENKQKQEKANKEVLEIEARLNELERARPYLINSTILEEGYFYFDRTEKLYTRLKELKKNIATGKLAPDIQFILTDKP